MTAIALVIVAVLLLIVVALFNRLVRFRNHTRAAWADVDTALKRRADLIPNLVEAVKGYAAHEQSLFEQVAKARTDTEAAHNVPAAAEAEQETGGALSRLMAVAENYPDLKASQNFIDLQQSLSETEDRIAITRHVYNDTVRTYENAREQFPSSLVARTFRFHEVQFFQLDVESDRNPVEVQA